MERIAFSRLVPGRASGEWRSVLPQGFPKREVYVCEGIRESIAEKAERATDAKTEAGEDGRC